MKTLLSVLSICLLFAASTNSRAQGNLPIVDGVEWQPLNAQIKRLVEALDYQGAPLAPEDQSALNKVLAGSADNSVEQVQKILDPYCLFFVNINPESRVKVAHGPAKAVLVEQG